MVKCPAALPKVPGTGILPLELCFYLLVHIFKTTVSKPVIVGTLINCVLNLAVEKFEFGCKFP